MKSLPVAMLAVFIAAASYTACPASADGTTPRLDLAPAQWHEDLQVFARELPRRDANAFATLPKAQFDAEVAALDARLDGADGDVAVVGLQTIAKSIGDGHACVVAPPDRQVMPLEFGRFGGEIRVVAASHGLERTLGARLIAIGTTSAGDAWDRALTLTAQGESTELRTGEALSYLARGYALHGLGITPDRGHALYTFRARDGSTFGINVKGLAPDQTAAMTARYDAGARPFQQAGETDAEMPNASQEPAQFELPNSHLVVRVPT